MAHHSDSSTVLLPPASVPLRSKHSIGLTSASSLHPPDLLNLPEEVLVAVLSTCACHTDRRDRASVNAPGRKAILNFALSCRKAYRLARPFLHHTLTLRTKRDAIRSHQLMLDDNVRRDHLRDLALIPPADLLRGTAAAKAADTQAMGPWLEVLANSPALETLHIQLPNTQMDVVVDEETGWYHSPIWASMLDHLGIRIGQLPAKPHLPNANWFASIRFCKLVVNGPYGVCSKIHNLAALLAAPFLTRLHLISADLSDFRINPRTTVARSSVLQQLQLEDCMLAEQGIYHLLTLPRALKSFSDFGSGRQYETLSPLDRLGGVIVALKMHVTSLKSLSLHPRHVKHISSTELGRKLLLLVQFTSLRDMTFAYTDARLSFSSSCRLLLSLLPKSLTSFSLRVEVPSRLNHYARPVKADQPVEFSVSWAEAILKRRTACPTCHQGCRALTMPRLKTLNIHLLNLAREDLSTANTDSLETIAFHLRQKVGIHTFVYRGAKQHNAIPPYLWDEYVPEEVLVLDSATMCEQSLWSSVHPTELELAEKLELKRLIELDQIEIEEAKQQEVTQHEAWEAQSMPPGKPGWHSLGIQGYDMISGNIVTPMISVGGPFHPAHSLLHAPAQDL
jgi:hypothetical protein